jgi:hypothetical protein
MKPAEAKSRGTKLISAFRMGNYKHSLYVTLFGRVTIRFGFRPWSVHRLRVEA